jgi:negative modulator of initiation of replication
MKVIEIDDEVYKFLISNIRDFGDSPSSVFKRLVMKEQGLEQIFDTKIPVEHAFSKLFAQPKFKLANSVVEKFILLLSEIYSQKGKEFEVILGKKKRSRINFGRSYEEILNSGRSCNPKKIIGSSYWVDTNNNTSQKKTLLKDVLSVLSYDMLAIKAATDALRK